MTLSTTGQSPLVNSTPTRIRNLGHLRRGDSVEARMDNAVQYRGRVDRTAPGVGLVWIRDDADGSRRAISTQDCTVWRLPSQQA
ncbi:hypothetical protein [Arthrobacter sp. NPDC089319]|jgi:hypothetical protein|uniref:hypothetical protein n=1 Tax=Arthrobacter sp. NPDC089319 TaxID=3155915 RepID=UPI0034320ADE